MGGSAFRLASRSAVDQAAGPYRAQQGLNTGVSLPTFPSRSKWWRFLCRFCARGIVAKGPLSGVITA